VPTGRQTDKPNKSTVEDESPQQERKTDILNSCFIMETFLEKWMYMKGNKFTGRVKHDIHDGNNEPRDQKVKLGRSDSLALHAPANNQSLNSSFQKNSVRGIKVENNATISVEETTYEDENEKKNKSKKKSAKGSKSRNRINSSDTEILVAIPPRNFPVTEQVDSSPSTRRTHRELLIESMMSPADPGGRKTEQQLKNTQTKKGISSSFKRPPYKPGETPVIKLPPGSENFEIVDTDAIQFNRRKDDKPERKSVCDLNADKCIVFLSRIFLIHTL